MFSGVAANVVARREARLSGNTDGDERRHGPPVAQPSHEPLATCRFVRYFDGCHSPTDDQTSIVGDVAIAMAEVIERRSADGSSANDEIDVTSPEPGCSIASSPLPSSNSAAAPPSGRPRDADWTPATSSGNASNSAANDASESGKSALSNSKGAPTATATVVGVVSSTEPPSPQSTSSSGTPSTRLKQRVDVLASLLHLNISDPHPPVRVNRPQSDASRAGGRSGRVSTATPASPAGSARRSCRLLLFDLPRLALVSVDDDLDTPRRGVGTDTVGRARLAVRALCRKVTSRPRARVTTDWAMLAYPVEGRNTVDGCTTPDTESGRSAGVVPVDRQACRGFPDVGACRRCRRYLSRRRSTPPPRSVARARSHGAT